MIGPSRHAMEPKTFAGPDLPVGASPTGGAVLNASDTRHSCDRGPAPVPPGHHVPARDATRSQGAHGWFPLGDASPANAAHEGLARASWTPPCRDRPELVHPSRGRSLVRCYVAHTSQGPS